MIAQAKGSRLKVRKTTKLRAAAAAVRRAVAPSLKPSGDPNVNTSGVFVRGVKGVNVPVPKPAHVTLRVARGADGWYRSASSVQWGAHQEGSSRGVWASTTGFATEQDALLAELERVAEGFRSRSSRAGASEREKGIYLKALAVLDAYRLKLVPAAPSTLAKSGEAAGELRIHPLAELLPRMSSEEMLALVEDVTRVGRIRVPIVLHEGKILDGRHRYEVARKCGFKFETRVFDPKVEGDPLDFVYSQEQRRTMDKSQKAAAAVRFEEVEEERTKERQAARSTRAAALKRLGFDGLKEKHPEHYTVLGTLEGIVERVLDAELGKLPGTSRDRAGRRFGVSGRYVQDCKLLKEKSPELFLDVFEGRRPVKVALAEHNRRVKAADQERKAAEAKASATTNRNRRSPFTLITGDALVEISKLEERPRLIATDPRYNLGYDYGLGKEADSTPEPVYLKWSKQWIELCADKLAEDGTLVVIIDGRHQYRLACYMEDAGLSHFNTIVNYERFGNYSEENFTPCARFIHVFRKQGRRGPFNGGDIRVPSARMTDYKDKRNRGPKVPGNVWDEFVAELPPLIVPPNVWTDCPRVVGNAEERNLFPNQMSVKLMDRIVRAFSDPGDVVVDPFNGSGTTGEASLRAGRRYVGIDIVPRNVEYADVRLTNVAAEMKGGK